MIVASAIFITGIALAFFSNRAEKKQELCQGTEYNNNIARLFFVGLFLAIISGTWIILLHLL